MVRGVGAWGRDAPEREDAARHRGLRGRLRGAGTPLGLAAAAYLLAFLQRAGLNTSDTKINLHVDPTRFLGQVAAVWNHSAGLGHVQSGQYPGYLWPMGPFFALGHVLGISDWVCERLWLGTLLFLAAWGAVRLMDALYDRRRGPAHVVAGVLFMLNPYVVVVTSRTTVTLLAYAALPWLLLLTHRGLREPRRWWSPAAFGLIFTSTAAGVNATVSAFILLGPVVLVLYEMFVGEVRAADVLALGWRTALATAASSVWWAIPVLLQPRYGTNFLQFTEQVGVVWATTSLSESLRLMGYWPTYLGVGYASRLIPYFTSAQTMLFNPAVVAASLLVPGLALTGYVLDRRWRYGPFFLLLALVSLLAMTVGWPPGTPARHAFLLIYSHLSALQFLRTTYKAGPLLALSLAALGGSAYAVLWRRWPLGVRLASVATAGALVVLATLPFFQGRGLELTWKRIPAAWRQTGRYLDRQLPNNSRALVLPGQEYAFYRWGATIDPILPALTTRPVAVRNVPPYDDLHAVDFLWTVDDLVQQDRLLPGQLRPLLDLMSARSVVVGSDDNRALSGAVDPAVAARALASQPGFNHPARSFGPMQTFPGPSTGAQQAVALPQVRTYDLPARGMVRLEPAGPATVLDGSAQGLADMAALQGLPRSGPLFYAGDETAGELKSQALAGARVVITDSNRRRVFVASRVRQNYGWTISAADAPPPQSALLNPFSALGSQAETVAVFRGARDLTTPFNPQDAQFPQFRPIAAFDGDIHTAWLADPTLEPSQQWLQIDLNRPRDIPRLEILPYQKTAEALQTLSINGQTFGVHPGWNELPVSLRHVQDIRIAIGHVTPSRAFRGPSVGLAEARIPGVHVQELLRVPTLAERALRGVNLSHTQLSYLFERTTAASPLRRGPPLPIALPRGDRLQQEPALTSQARDAETGIARQIDPPAARLWTLSGLASVSPAAPDPNLDSLAGTDTHGWAFSSSGRLEGLPGFRASSAFDGSGATGWAAPFVQNDRPWIAWRSPTVRTLRRLRLVATGLPVGFPSRVSVTAGARSAGPLPVGPNGVVALPIPLRGRSFRLSVLDMTGSGRPSVGIAEVLGTGAPASVTRQGPVHGRCGDLAAEVGHRSVPLRLSGSIQALDAGQPLSLSQCPGAVALAPALTDIVIAPRAFAPLLIQLRSAAPAGPASSAPGGGTILDAGHQTNGSFTGVRVSARGPSWLVLGESYNRGWSATCSGRSLGPPRVIDAYANGWRIGPRCHAVSITFSPQSLVDYGYAIGALACLLLVLVLILRRTPGISRARPADLALPASASRWAPVRALIGGLAAAAIIGLVFGLRAGAVAGPVIALVLWRGTPTIRLVQLAGVLLGIVVVIYLVFPGENQGGFDNGFTSQHLGAHWVAVGAFVLLAVALIRDLTAISRATRRPAGGPAARPAQLSRPRERV